MPDDEVLSLSEGSDEQEWLEDEDEEEEEGVTIISLLDDRVFSDPFSMLSYCKEKYNLDFLGIRNRLGLDFHGTVKLINFIRQRVHEGAALPEEILPSDFEDERYLKPVLDDDALVLCLDDLPAHPSEETKESGPQAEASSGTAQDLIRRNTELHTELEELANQFNNYRLAVQQTLDRRWGDGELGVSSSPSENNMPTTDREAGKDDSASYWESYAHNDIHETMLKDRVRTDAYRDFIYGNKELFAGKVVLDVGCGTGILSMFCAKAGAKQVIAVDKSDIIDKARENVFNNDLGRQITCLRGRIEELVLPVQEVDVIVSEWMGYCLLYEAMLPSIIWARDKYLKPDGLLVPSHASLWIAPISDPEYVVDNVTFWRDVYGFDMKAMQAGIYTDVRVQMMPESSLGGVPYAFKFFDLYSTKIEDLVFDTTWRTELNTDSDGVDGFLIWFDIFFAQVRTDDTVLPSLSARDWSSAGKDRVSFTTGPYGQETHWRQGVLLNAKHSELSQSKADRELNGRITFSTPQKHARGLDISATWGAPGQRDRNQSWLLH